MASGEAAAKASATRTRPSALSYLLYDRGVRFAAGLAVVVAIPVAVLFYFQFRALNALEKTSAVVLRQLSQATADGVAKDIEEALKRPYIRVLLRIPQGRTEPLDFQFIEPVFVQGLTESPFVEAFYIWSATEGAAAPGPMYVFNRASLAEEPGEFERRFRRASGVERDFMRRLNELAKYKTAIISFAETIGGRRKYVQAQLRYANNSTRDRMSSFVALVVDAQDFREQHLPALLAQRASSIQGPTGFPPLDVSLLDERGTLIFSSHQPAPTGYVDERSFPIVFFDKELLEFAAPLETDRETWVLRTSYGNDSIAGVVSASTRPQLALMVILAIVMGCGVFFVAGAAAREVRLAELKSNFVASVSHDLKTPLALIQLFAETLELGRVRSSERAVEYYRIINTEAKKLTRLIENILDFSKMEAGLRPYRMAPTDVGELVTKVLREMDSQFSQGQFTVRAAIEPGLPRLAMDCDAVEQALENLLANAMKYSGESREIDVTARRDGDQVVLDVTDHGIGIPRRELKRIFRKFYRVESELGGGPQGCGLGLAIVDHTMRGHGGHVLVESEPDRGSTFTLCFPIPAGLPAPDGEVDEADPGNRGRAADAARPA
jgi:signal transduction histidine kinase